MDVCERWGTSGNDFCPLCKCFAETAGHVLECPHFLMQAKRNKSLLHTGDEMGKLNTDPNLKKMLLDILMNHSLGLPQTPPETKELCDVFFSMLNVGWENLHKGFLTKKTVQYQQNFLKNGNFHKSSNIDRWCNTMVDLLIGHYRALWKTRCEIVSAQKTDTLLMRTRTIAKTRWEKLRKEKWKYRAADWDQISKNSTFFNTATMTMLQFWFENVKLAQMRAYTQMKKISGDIRIYFKKGDKKNNKNVRRKASTNLTPSAVTWSQLLKKKYRSNRIVVSTHKRKQKLTVDRVSRKKVVRMKKLDEWLCRKHVRLKTNTVYENTLDQCETGCVNSARGSFCNKCNP